MKFFLPLLLLFFNYHCFSATYYVASSNGNDAFAGNIGFPFKTITKAVSVAVPGDIIYVRGGVHVYNTRISIASSKNGTITNKYYLLAYPGERPVLDFSGMAVGSSNQGLRLAGSYWVIRGFDFYKAGDNGMELVGSNNIIEFCSFYDNQDTGLQLDGGASNNQIINCDSYYNVDPDNGNADGFAVKLDVGTGNSFRGCRAWYNSDDGWDGYMRPSDNVTTTLDSCWTFRNGYLKTGVASAGNGNGFKMGGSDADDLRHNMTLKNCVSVYNRVKGFDQNNNRGDMFLYNCTGYRNSPNFGLNNGAVASGKQMVVKNCISYSNRGSSSDVFWTGSTRTNNSFPSFTLTAADFLSLDTSLIRVARSADGSIPSTAFMRLANGSSLIDAGTNVGIAYNGAAPDLGAFESNYILPVSLLSLSATVEQSIVLINWATSTEINNKGWQVEKLALGADWKKVGFVTGAGNSTANNFYSLRDEQFGLGITQYRLKQVDFDGSFKYSPIVSVHFKGYTKENIAIFPNPVTDKTTIHFNISEKKTVQLQIWNGLGQLVQILMKDNLNAGHYIKTINLSNLSAGQYTVKLIYGEEEKQVQLIKVN